MDKLLFTKETLHGSWAYSAKPSFPKRPNWIPVLIIIFLLIILSFFIKAKESAESSEKYEEKSEEISTYLIPNTKTTLEVVKKRQNLGFKTISAYTPNIEETDSAPCVGARNINVCDKLEQGEAVCATHLVPIGTKLQIGDLLSCTVYDRTSRKFADRVDVMFPANMIDEAKSFGIKREEVYIIN